MEDIIKKILGEAGESGGGNPWVQLGMSLLPGLMSWGANKGSNQAQEEALKRMMQIATGQYNMQAKQANMDLPLRQDLFAALRNREQQKAPRIQPGSFKPSNPYERLNRVGPTNPSALSPALMGAGTPALGAGYQPPAAIANPLISRGGSPSATEQQQENASGLLKHSS
jgi:hypothetical protein